MHEGHRERVRTRFLKEGLRNFEPHEALELLLFYTIPRTDTNPIAHRLMERFGSFDGVLDAALEELLEVEGVGENTAVFLKLLPEVAGYYNRSRWSEKPFLDSVYAAGRFAADQIGNEQKEVFLLICLNAQRRVLCSRIISEGEITMAAISTRRVAEIALNAKAASVILAHNHPSGVLMASQQDRDLTNSLCMLFESMDIQVIDHFIVAGDRFTSMVERGIMPL